MLYGLGSLHGKPGDPLEGQIEGFCRITSLPIEAGYGACKITWALRLCLCQTVASSSPNLSMW